MKKEKVGTKKPVRTRKKLNVTISDEARQMGQQLAERDGITFSRLIEMMLRERARNRGTEGK